MKPLPACAPMRPRRRTTLANRGQACWRLGAVTAMLATALIGLAGVPAAATAASPVADPCAAAADEAALLACRQAALADVTQRLRQAIDTLRQRYQADEPARWKLLQAAQQAWRGYSQAECRFTQFESAGGSAYRAYSLSCLTALAERRLQDLQAIVATP